MNKKTHISNWENNWLQKDSEHKGKKIPNDYFYLIKIMASCSFVFKEVRIYSCNVLYTEKYFNVIAELESNYNFPQNNIYKNSFNV